MTTSTPPALESPTKRPRWRLRVLLALTVVALGLYGFARLDRSVAERLGPLGEAVHDLLSASRPDKAPDNPAARRFKADVMALHATPSVVVIQPGFLGVWGRVEDFGVNTHDEAFDDAALAQLANRYGDRITGILLQNTAVSNAGLQALAKFPRLRQLTISHPSLATRPGFTPTPSRIDDAGMTHLRGLTNLGFLSVNYVPITDAGLDAIKELPGLNSLYLHGTQVQGRSLANAKWLPRLFILYADGTPFGEDGLKALQRATSLQILSLNQVPLESTAIPLLRALPLRLDRLEITGCGFLDEEVATLRRPGLKINRR